VHVRISKHVLIPVVWLCHVYVSAFVCVYVCVLDQQEILQEEIYDEADQQEKNALASLRRIRKKARLVSGACVSTPVMTIGLGPVLVCSIRAQSRGPRFLFAGFPHAHGSLRLVSVCLLYMCRCTRR
jgi:hypothetical protein